MMESELINLISTVGFPIVITGWFMFHTEKILAANTEAIGKLTEVILEMNKK